MKANYDVLIIGAGLSGIGMACHLAEACPGKRIGILERRHAIGGTWALFRYPGIRSDSDMFSFGYKFRPWHELKVLADGPSIRRYIADTAREYGVDPVSTMQAPDSPAIARITPAPCPPTTPASASA